MNKVLTIRKGQASAVLSRKVFHDRFMPSFMDPAFKPEAEALGRIESVAWDAYKDGRKAPVTRKAGRGYAVVVNGAVAHAVKALRASAVIADIKL